MRTDPMTLASLLFLLKATGVLLLTITGAALLRRAPAELRHSLWLTALALVLALPLLALTLPDWRVLPVPEPALASAPSTARDAQAPTGGAWAAGDASDPAQPLREQDAGALRFDPRPPPWAAEATAPAEEPALTGRLARIQLPALLFALWGLGALIVLARLGRSALRLRRILDDADPLTGSNWTTPLWEAADRLNLADAPHLVQSERVTMPFACGLLRPTIVVPASASSWSASRRRAVLFHELAHIRRRDLFGHTLGRLACALYWMHPLVWTAARRLRAESERACDDLVLAAGTPASEYADHLLQILVGVRGNDAPAVALPMGRRREFEGRMLAILDPALRRHGARLAHAGVLAALSVAALLLMALAPIEAASPPSAEPPTPLEQPPAPEQSPMPPAAPGWAAEANGPADSAAAAADSAPLPAAKAEPQTGLAGGKAEPSVRPRPPAGTRLAEEFGTRVASAVEDLVVDVGKILFGQVGENQKSIPLLMRTLATDESAEVRRTAAWSLAGTGNADADAALIRALREDEDADVREMAAWGLSQVRTSEAIAALVRALGDPAGDVRGRAAWGLGHSGLAEPRVLDPLAVALGDVEGEVRVIAAWAIGTLRPAAAPPPLHGRLLSDPDATIRLAGAWALGQIADPASRPALAAALEREQDAQALRAISRALRQLGPLDEAVIAKLLTSPDPEIRAQAIRMAAGVAPEPWPWPWPEPRPFP